MISFEFIFANREIEHGDIVYYYIGFTMYSTCLIWLAFVPIYFSTADNIEIRLATMCFSITFSATVALVCLFAPKLYIILLRPEQNVRQSMITSKSLIKHQPSFTHAANNQCHAVVDSCTQSDGMYKHLSAKYRGI